MIVRLSKRLVLVNVILALVAVFFVVSIVKDLGRARPLPLPPPPRRGQVAVTPAAPEGAAPAAAEDKLGAYNVIVAKHLFNPSRSEGGPVAATPAAPPPPKPMLLGVIVDGPKSRAYLEDSTTKRVFGYQIGDAISGGRLDKITEDKVVIVRPEGAIDVLLRDPSKPKPTPTAAGGPAAQQPQPPARAGNPGQQPARTIRRLPAEQPPQAQAPQHAPQQPPAEEPEQ